MLRQRLLRALLSTLGDGAATKTKLRGLQAIRLLLAALAGGSAAASGPHSRAVDLGGSAPPTAAPAAQHGVASTVANAPCGSGKSKASGRSALQHDAHSNDAGTTGSRQSDDGSGGDSASVAPAAAELSEEDWAAAAKKLGKRLEDGEDAIRIAACGALAELARCRVAGAGFSAQHGSDAKADDGELSSCTSEPPTHASPEGKGGGRNGSSKQDAEGPSAVEKLLSSLHLHACDDNPAVAAAAVAVVQQLQSSQLVS